MPSHFGPRPDSSRRSKILFQTPRVLLCLLQMLIESSRELAVRRLAHFRERFDQLLFRTVKVS
jgi:hypothetical protein